MKVCRDSLKEIQLIDKEMAELCVEKVGVGGSRVGSFSVFSHLPIKTKSYDF